MIRVEPVIDDELRNDAIESRVVVTFGLREKPGTDGKGLLAYRPKAVAWSEEVPKKAREATERALTKWLFFSKTHAAADEHLYYQVFTF